MRAEQVMSAASPSQLATMRRALQVEGGADDVVQAMRRDAVVEQLHRRYRSRRQRAELAALCANPFEALGADEVEDLEAWTECGLLAPSGDGLYAVNLDLALTVLPHESLELGYAATLLARLPAEDLGPMARALGVSPRATRVDYLLAIATAWTSPDTWRDGLMLLTEEEREPLREALALGELPDLSGRWDPATVPPLVRLGTRAAGQRGLLVRVTSETIGAADRPVVALEAMDSAREALATVPAPSVTARRAPRRAAGMAGGASGREGASGRSSSRASGRAVTPAPESGAGPLAPTPGRLVQTVSASALVDLGSEERARRAYDDRELGEDVLEVIELRWVVLREGVDVARWCERCAVRLSTSS